ncbi:MAG: hypothetical protein IPM04_19565 [Saprospiraceae bacterium]|nr:hypothetical protein [Candidatus Brachybacter algidus]MBK8749934.1 hypothetical protein [Candidatus Brachybacter algidus]
MIKLVEANITRIIGNDNFRIIAEIWQHTDPINPSNEDDILGCRMTLREKVAI